MDKIDFIGRCFKATSKFGHPSRIAFFKGDDDYQMCIIQKRILIPNDQVTPELLKEGGRIVKQGKDKTLLEYEVPMSIGQFLGIIKIMLGLVECDGAILEDNKVELIRLEK